MLLIEADLRSLCQAREDYQAGTGASRQWIDSIIRSADHKCSAPIESVTHKTRLAASGNPRDYRSIGPYWWPDPEKADGLPYIRRDGQVNPEADEESSVDRPRFTRLTEAVGFLALAGWMTGQKKYTDKAAQLLHAWFIDPQLSMTANLNYAQAIPGKLDGRGIGIIDFTGIVSVLDSVHLLRQCEGWPVELDTGITQWISEFSGWLRNSGHGQDERDQKNNHGTWYDVIDVSLSLFLNDPGYAREVLTNRTVKRINAHFKPDGAQPHELARTLSLSYSTMNLRGFLLLARAGGHVDVDLWAHAGPEGQTIGAGLDFLLPYLDPKNPWPYPQIKDDPTRWSLWTVLLDAADQTQRAEWKSRIKLPSKPTESQAVTLVKYAGEVV
jgi:hypothetical protein